MKRKLFIRYFVKVERGHYAIFDSENFDYAGPDPVPWGSAKPLVCRLPFEEAWKYARRIEDEWEKLFPGQDSKSR